MSNFRFLFPPPPMLSLMVSARDERLISAAPPLCFPRTFPPIFFLFFASFFVPHVFSHGSSKGWIACFYFFFLRRRATCPLDRSQVHAVYPHLTIRQLKQEVVLHLTVINNNNNNNSIHDPQEEGFIQRLASIRMRRSLCHKTHNFFNCEIL